MQEILKLLSFLIGRLSPSKSDNV